MISPKKDKQRQSRAGPNGRSSTRHYRFGRSSATPSSPFRNTGGAGQKASWRSRAVDVVLLTTVIGLVVFNFLVTSPPRINIDDSSYRAQQTYESAVREEFADLRGKSKITLNTQKVADNLKQRFPEISKVTIGVPLVGSTVTVNIEVAKPVLKLVSGGGVYVINTSGVASGLADDLPAAGNLPLVLDESGFSVSVGQPVLEAASVNFIKSLSEQLKMANVPIASLTLPPRAKELDLRTSDQPYYVKFYLGGDAAAQIGQYLATRQQFANDGTIPSQYLDVRVQGKAFYK